MVGGVVHNTVELQLTSPAITQVQSRHIISAYERPVGNVSYILQLISFSNFRHREISVIDIGAGT